MKKFFNKVKSFIYSEWKFIFVVIVLYLAMNFEFPCVIYTPGGAINLSSRISGDNTYKESGSLSMTYVQVISGKLPYIILSKFISNWDLEASNKVVYDNTNLEETFLIDQLYMREAYSNAEYVAYKAANIEFEEINNKNYVTMIDKKAKTNLKFGDEILSLDDNNYDGLVNLQKYISQKKEGDVVRIKYKRNGKIHEDRSVVQNYEGNLKIGIGIASISDYKTDYNIKIKSKSSESGPSGGLITALAIYNSVTKDDITKGMKIMGTGTIDKDGTVGPIGGVKYKVLGAYNSGADVFICPADNYKEALKTIKDNHLKLKLIKVSNFDEAIEKLKNIS